MKRSDCIRASRKLQFATPILLFLLLGGCSGSDSPGLVVQPDSDMSFVLKVNAGPRREVCWRGTSRMDDMELQQIQSSRFQRLECNLIKRRAVERRKEVLALMQ